MFIRLDLTPIQTPKFIGGDVKRPEIDTLRMESIGDDPNPIGDNLIQLILFKKFLGMLSGAYNEVFDSDGPHAIR